MRNTTHKAGLNGTSHISRFYLVSKSAGIGLIFASKVGWKLIIVCFQDLPYSLCVVRLKDHAWRISDAIVVMVFSFLFWCNYPRHYIGPMVGPCYNLVGLCLHLPSVSLFITSLRASLSRVNQAAFQPPSPACNSMIMWDLVSQECYRWQFCLHSPIVVLHRHFTCFQAHLRYRWSSALAWLVPENCKTKWHNSEPIFSKEPMLLMGNWFLIWYIFYTQTT